MALSWQPVESKTGAGSVANAAGAGPQTKRITLEKRLPACTDGQASPLPYCAPTIKPVVLLTIQLENEPNDDNTGAEGVLLGVALGVALAFALGLEVTLNDRLGVAVALALAENPALGEAEGVALALTAAPVPGTPETSAVTPISGLMLKA